MSSSEWFLLIPNTTGSVVTKGDPNLLYKRTKRIGQGYVYNASDKTLFFLTRLQCFGICLFSESYHNKCKSRSETNGFSQTIATRPDCK